MPDADFPITVDYDDTYWLGIEQGYVLLDVLGTQHGLIYQEYIKQGHHRQHGMMYGTC